MAETVIGALSVKITADTKGVQDGIKASGKALKIGSQQLRDSANRWGKWALAATAAAAGVAAAIVKSNLASIKELKNLAVAADTQVAAFQRGAFAASTAGISTEKYGDILKDVNDRIGDFLISGAGPMVDFFEVIGPKVGITADAFKDLSGQDALGLYVKTLEEAGVSQQEMTFFMEALAGDSIRLAPLFQNNAKAFNALTQEAKALGIGLSDIDVAKAELASAELAKAAGVIEALTQQATVELAPIIAAVTELFVDMAKEAGGAGEFIKKVIKSVVSVIGVFADGLHAIELIFKGLEVAALGFTSAVTVATAELAETIENLGDKFKEIGKTQGAIGGQFRALGFIFGKTKEQADGLSKSVAQIARDIATSQIEALQMKLLALSDAALQPLPSEGIKTFVDEAVLEYEKLAVAKAAALGDVDLKGEGVGTKTTSEIELVEAETIGLLEALGLRFQSQEEMQLAHLEREHEMLKAAKERGELTTILFKEKEAEILQASEDVKRQITLQGIQEGFQALAAGSKKVTKALAIASTIQAVIKGYHAAVNSYEAGTKIGGPVVGAAFAAASLATTGALIKKINSGSKTQGSISGGAPAAAIGGQSQAAAPQQQAQQVNRSIDVNFIGSGVMSMDAVRELIEQFNEALGDGAQLNVIGG